MEFKEIIYAKEDGVALITLNRPEQMNSTSAEMSAEWMQAQEDAQRDREIKVIVVTGAGRAFCAGGSPREMAKRGSQPMRPRYPSLARAILQVTKPYIAAINGPCVGSGLELASVCDLRIASDKARFGAGFIRVGRTPSNIACYTLPRLIGIHRALEWLWTGRLVDAQEALDSGFLNKVVPHEELMPTTLALAQSLVRGPTIAIEETKHLAYLCLNLDAEEAMLHHRRASQRISTTEDAIEGPRAWVEKREPIFKGR